MDNLSIYNQARTVPEEAKKPISAGRLKGMTDINPMYRIKRLTELFGPCGVGWWYDITDKHLAADDYTKQVAAFVDIKLYYIDPVSGHESHGIPGTGGASFVAQERNGPYMSDECYKMALTDAISVAAKALGIGADVYWDKDRSKYSSCLDAGDEPPEQGNTSGGFIPACADCGETITPAEHDYSVKKFKRPLCRKCQSAAGMQFKCQHCGTVLKPYIGADDKEVSVRKHAEGSKQKFNGAVFCIDCIMKAQAEGQAAQAGEGA